MCFAGSAEFNNPQRWVHIPHCGGEGNENRPQCPPPRLRRYFAARKELPKPKRISPLNSEEHFSRMEEYYVSFLRKQESRLFYDCSSASLE